MSKSKKQKPREVLRDVDRAIIQSVMFECGILPMEKVTLDMRRALQQLSPDEARVLKRKFRKLWRKAMREEIGAGKLKNLREDQAKQKFGVGKHAPSRAERTERKKLVFNMLWNRLIEPMITKFENPDSQTKQEKSQ